MPQEPDGGPGVGRSGRGLLGVLRGSPRTQENRPGSCPERESPEKCRGEGGGPKKGARPGGGGVPVGGGCNVEGVGGIPAKRHRSAVGRGVGGVLWNPRGTVTVNCPSPTTNHAPPSAIGSARSDAQDVPCYAPAQVIQVARSKAGDGRRRHAGPQSDPAPGHPSRLEDDDVAASPALEIGRGGNSGPASLSQSLRRHQILDGGGGLRCSGGWARSWPPWTCWHRRHAGINRQHPEPGWWSCSASGGSWSALSARSPSQTIRKWQDNPSASNAARSRS